MRYSQLECFGNVESVAAPGEGKGDICPSPPQKMSFPQFAPLALSEIKKKLQSGQN